MTQATIDTFNLGLRLQAAKNYDKALQLLQMAADNGYALALHRLGDTFLFAMGVEKNDTKAFSYYNRAAGIGIISSSYSVNKCQHSVDSVADVALPIFPATSSA
ncbi:2399_t:CDS:2 [Paraglomus occultum]|uniref:2399_t:CDS:1 n=1 Tax=Paraglomus occultum TaxID=144539 RepID=A0A9N8ZNH8_9GLOM|nr:2399_t:CDS:2 [Paraglomus occultum]